MLMKGDKLVFTLILVLSALAACVVNAVAEDRIGFGYALVDDGTCGVTQHTLTAEYDREGEDLEVRGRVRAEPAGGDCRKETISYDVLAVRYFELEGGIDAFAEFGASEQSVGATYDLADPAGMVFLRPDGNALFSTNLPAGSAKTVIGALGLSKDFGALRIGGGYNLVPVDWANHEPGRTAHLTTGLDLGRFDLDASVDIGASHFGEVSAHYRHTLDGSRMSFGWGLSYYFGIGEIDSGAPGTQYIRGSRFNLAGPPRNDSLVVSMTLGFSPR